MPGKHSDQNCYFFLPDLAIWSEKHSTKFTLPPPILVFFWKKWKVLRIGWFVKKVDQKKFQKFPPPPPNFSFFFEKNEKCLELADLARKLIRKNFKNFPPQDTCTENFGWCRCGAARRVKHAQTLERGPPLAWAEFHPVLLRKFNFYDHKVLIFLLLWSPCKISES